MDQTQDAALGLAALVLDQLSPPEVPLVEVVGPSLLDGPPDGDGALGFGVQDLPWLVVAVPVSKAAVDVMLGMAKEIAVEQLSRPVSSWVHRLSGIGRREIVVAAAEALPIEVVTRVHAAAYRKALAIGVEETRARLMADAVAGTLSMRTG
jgi:hypothetical protein